MERLVQTGVNFDFAYEYEEDFDFETGSYSHKGGDFHLQQLVACNSSYPNWTHSHDGHADYIHPHNTFWPEGDHDGSNLRANLAMPSTVSSTAQPVADTVYQPTMYLKEQWLNNSNSFLHEQHINNLMIDHATHVRPQTNEYNVESAPNLPGEKICAKCHGNAGQEATTPTGIISSSPSSTSDSTTIEGSNQLSCKLSTCKHWNKPFRTKSDFNRHQLLHRPPKFRCPKDCCSRSRKGFHRKDKLISHLERGHHESKQQAKMLACDQEQAINAAMLEGVGL